MCMRAFYHSHRRCGRGLAIGVRWSLQREGATMRRGVPATFFIAVCIFVLLVSARQRAVRPPALPRPLSITRSFEITDKSIVGVFTLDRVLTQLIARSGVSGITSDQLIRQMFDTQNPKPGLIDADGPHCNDNFTNGVPSFNGFPRRCPTLE